MADGVQESFRLQAEQFFPEGKGTFIPALFCVFLDFSLDDLRSYVRTFKLSLETHLNQEQVPGCTHS